MASSKGTGNMVTRRRGDTKILPFSVSNNTPDAVPVVNGLHDFHGLPAIADGINLEWLGGRSGKLTPLILPLLFSNCLGDCRGVDPQLLRYVRHRNPILSTQNPCNL